MHLNNFRSFAATRFEPHPSGTTVITGPNGAGKTSLLEALAYLGLQRSFRGAPREAMVRTGCDSAVVRAELSRDGSPLLVEAEIVTAGRSRVQLNRRPNPDRRDLADAVPVTVFSPDDLALVQGGPAYRRDLLDDALRVIDRPTGALLDHLDRVLRQRGALLRQSGGRVTAEIAATLDVWDERLAAAGEELVAARTALLDDLRPGVAASYATLAGAAAGDVAPPASGAGSVALEYRASWQGDLRAALAAVRTDDVRRAVTTVGPHRDDVVLLVAGREARTQASQGEQRSLALSLRLAVHRLVAMRRSGPPVLLLDDVFSELDPARSRALVEALPGGQALLTTAVPLPPGMQVDQLFDVRELAGGVGG